MIKNISKFHRLKCVDLSFINIKAIAELMIHNQVMSATYMSGKSETNLRVSTGISKMQSFLRFCYVGISNI